MKHLIFCIFLTSSTSLFAQSVQIKCSDGKNYSGTTANEVIKKATVGKSYGSVTNTLDSKVKKLSITTVKNKTKTTCRLIGE